jgi:N-methylhydantoinase A/oxoprolinase/acetone carboxylase beta subunit
MWGNTVAIHNVFCSRKKTTKLNYQPAQYEKKLKLTKTVLEKKNKEKIKKTIWGNTVAINSVLKKKLQN